MNGIEVAHVESLFEDGPGRKYATAGSYRAGNISMPNGHPADGMTMHVSVGGGAIHNIIDPTCFEDGGPEWVCRYGDVESIRYSVASLLESYDYLVSGQISSEEAIRRLRILRAARAHRLQVRPTPTGA